VRVSLKIRATLYIAMTIKEIFIIVMRKIVCLQQINNKLCF